MARSTKAKRRPTARKQTSASRKASDKRDAGTREPPRKLYRSRREKIIAGVCGGIAEFAHIDPVWVRLVMALLLLADGVGLLLYIILWIIVPPNPHQVTTRATRAEAFIEQAQHGRGRQKGIAVLGIILIVLGALFLLDNLFSWFRFAYVWPIAIIAFGWYLLQRRR